MRPRRLVASLSLLLVASITSVRSSPSTDQAFWTDLAEKELDEALRVQWNLNTAKNVILFVGDGMGPNTITAARIHSGGETHRLVFETFPHVGLLKTYSANKMVPDSASTATALFCGVKVNQETAGVDATVSHRDCEASLRPKARLKSLAALALETGKSAGFVTTMRVTHATPAPLYAHSADRKWECESTMRQYARTEGCKDHARQLVEDWPGRDLNVILGGGKQVLVSNSSGSEADPLDTWSCIRRDGLDLIQEYKKDKQTRGLKYSYVSNNLELKEFDLNNTDYLLGIFANGHLKYDYERDQGPEGMPSITDMVEAAIQVLKRNQNGYFLMVEAGNIDMAHHRGTAKRAVSEAVAMERAVRAAANAVSTEDTLLIVTSDHTHTLTINGGVLESYLSPGEVCETMGLRAPMGHGPRLSPSFQVVVRIDPELADSAWKRQKTGELALAGEGGVVFVLKVGAGFGGKPAILTDSGGVLESYLSPGEVCETMGLRAPMGHGPRLSPSFQVVVRIDPELADSAWKRQKTGELALAGEGGVVFVLKVGAGFGGKPAILTDSVAGQSPEGTNYTTLSYGTGGPGSFHFEAVNGTVRRTDGGDTDSYLYEQVAGIQLVENSHGGGDVAIYAIGPFAHLFHNVHEQHYVFHACARAARLGKYSRAGARAVSALSSTWLASAAIAVIWRYYEITRSC